MCVCVGTGTSIVRSIMKDHKMSTNFIHKNQHKMTHNESRIILIENRIHRNESIFIDACTPYDVTLFRFIASEGI